MPCWVRHQEAQLSGASAPQLQGCLPSGPQVATYRSSVPCLPPAVVVVLGNSHNSMITGRTVQVSGERESPQIESMHRTRCNVTFSQHDIRVAVTVQYGILQYSRAQYDAVQCCAVQYSLAAHA